MFSIGDIRPLSSVSPGVRKFKPWWEHVIEYLCYGLLALSLVGWARVSSVSASSLTCMLKNASSLPDWTIRDATYSNQRCSIEMSGWILLFYPYLLLLQWFATFTIQYLWLKLPTVYSRLETFHKLYMDMTVVPTKSCQLYDDNVDYEGEAKDVMVALRTKLVWLLHEKSVVFRVYKTKVWLMKVLTIVTVSLQMYWLIHINTFETVFLCRLKAARAKIGYPDLICSLTTGILLYVLAISNLIVVGAMFLLNVGAMYWLFNQKNFVMPGLAAEYWKLCEKFEGFEDFRFTLHLIFDDINSGHQIVKILKFCLYDYLKGISRREIAMAGEAQTRL